MRRLALLPLLLLVAACDATTPDELTLDAAYYVGTWRLSTVSDAAGDRTAAVRAVVDLLTVRFDADGTFQIDVDFTDEANEGGLADRSATGTFVAQPGGRTLVLSDGTFAPTFTAVDATRDRITFTVASAVVQQLLVGTGLEFEGTVTLDLWRQ